MRRVLFLTLLSCLFLVTTGQVIAQSGDSFSDPVPLNINAGTDVGGDRRPQLTTDGAGRWVAVWESDDSLGGMIGTDWDILVARSMDNGQTWTDPAPLNTNADTDTKSDWWPQLTTDGAGRWVAVWSSRNSLGGLGTDWDILVAHSTDEGQTWTDPEPLNTNADIDSGWDIFAQLTTDGAGHWVAVWESTDSLGGTVDFDEDILVARSMDNGQTWTDPEPLNTNADTDDGDDSAPQLTTDGAGHWITVWESRNSLGGTIGTDLDILVARSMDNGQTWTDPAPLNTYATTDGSSERNSQLTTDSWGHWVAVWQAHYYLFGSDHDILTARSTDNGQTWTDPEPLNTNAGYDIGDDQRPQLTTDGVGRWVAVWESSSISLATSTDNGQTWTDPEPLNTNAGTDWGPQLTTDGLRHWVAVWASVDDLGGTIGTDWDILVARSRTPTLNTPPAANAGADFWGECDSVAGAAVTLDGSGSSDPDSTPGTNDDIVLFEWFEDYGLPSEKFLGAGELLDITLSLGDHVVTLRVTDSEGETDTDEVVVTIMDTIPPTVSVEAAPSMLWPPNHRMVDVHAAVTAADICSEPLITLAWITSNEPDNATGNGDGDTENDIQDAEVNTADFEFRLRAERAGSGDGRTYTVTYAAADSSGNASLAPALCTVPHDQGGVTEPIQSIVGDNGRGTVLWWSEVPHAHSYNVIRGHLGSITETESSIDLGTVACIEAGSVDASTEGWEDAVLPPPGQAFFYLIEYEHGSHSSYGTDTAAKPRVPSAGDCE